MLAASLVVLFIELVKSTASRRMAIVNHSLSMLLFVVCLLELLLAPALRHLDLLSHHPDGAAGRLGRLHRHIAAARREGDRLEE